MVVRRLKLGDIIQVTHMYRQRSDESKRQFDPFPDLLWKLIPILVFLHISNITGKILIDLSPNLRFISLVSLTSDCRPVGFGYLRFQNKNSTNLGIFVKEGYQGQGIGNELMEHLIAEAESTKVEKIRLQVLQSNDPAISLYRSFGFKVTGEIIITTSRNLNLPGYEMKYKIQN